jgi:hypothetical protein
MDTHIIPDEINLSLRLKGDSVILKLGDTTKELIVTNDLTDEVTQLAKLLLERRKEILDKRRREMLKELKKKEY